MKTYGELIKGLIALYEEGLYILDVTKNEDEAIDKLWELDIILGICNAALQNFKINIYNGDFVNHFLNGRFGYYCPPGSSLNDRLQLRMNRLNEIYEEWKDVEIPIEAFINES